MVGFSCFQIFHSIWNSDVIIALWVLFIFALLHLLLDMSKLVISAKSVANL